MENTSVTSEKSYSDIVMHSLHRFIRDAEALQAKGRNTYAESKLLSHAQLMIRLVDKLDSVTPEMESLSRSMYFKLGIGMIGVSLSNAFNLKNLINKSLCIKEGTYVEATA